MKRSAKIHKTANILLGLLISASYAANAMEGKEEDKESTAWIRAEVARVLGNFQRNMNAYYERTGNPKRITIADEETKAKQTEREAAEEEAIESEVSEEIQRVEVVRDEAVPKEEDKERKAAIQDADETVKLLDHYWPWVQNQLFLAKSDVEKNIDDFRKNNNPRKDENIYWQAAYLRHILGGVFVTPFDLRTVDRFKKLDSSLGEPTKAQFYAMIHLGTHDFETRRVLQSAAEGKIISISQTNEILHKVDGFVQRYKKAESDLQYHLNRDDFIVAAIVKYPRSGKKYIHLYRSGYAKIYTNHYDEFFDPADLGFSEETVNEIWAEREKASQEPVTKVFLRKNDPLIKDNMKINHIRLEKSFLGSKSMRALHEWSHGRDPEYPRHTTPKDDPKRPDLTEEVLSRPLSEKPDKDQIFEWIRQQDELGLESPDLDRINEGVRQIRRLRKKRDGAPWRHLFFGRRTNALGEREPGIEQIREGLHLAEVLINPTLSQISEAIRQIELGNQNPHPDQIKEGIRQIKLGMQSPSLEEINVGLELEKEGKKNPGEIDIKVKILSKTMSREEALNRANELIKERKEEEEKKRAAEAKERDKIKAIMEISDLTDREISIIEKIKELSGGLPNKEEFKFWRDYSSYLNENNFKASKYMENELGIGIKDQSPSVIGVMAGLMREGNKTPSKENFNDRLIFNIFNRVPTQKEKAEIERQEAERWINVRNDAPESLYKVIQQGIHLGPNSTQEQIKEGVSLKRSEADYATQEQVEAALEIKRRYLNIYEQSTHLTFQDVDAWNYLTKTLGIEGPVGRDLYFMSWNEDTVPVEHTPALQKREGHDLYFMSEDEETVPGGYTLALKKLPDNTYKLFVRGEHGVRAYNPQYFGINGEGLDELWTTKRDSRAKLLKDDDEIMQAIVNKGYRLSKYKVFVEGKDGLVEAYDSQKLNIDDKDLDELWNKRANPDNEFLSYDNKIMQAIAKISQDDSYKEYARTFGDLFDSYVPVVKKYIENKQAANDAWEFLTNIARIKMDANNKEEIRNFIKSYIPKVMRILQHQGIKSLEEAWQKLQILQAQDTNLIDLNSKEGIETVLEDYIPAALRLRRPMDSMKSPAAFLQSIKKFKADRERRREQQERMVREAEEKAEQAKAESLRGKARKAVQRAAALHKTDTTTTTTTTTTTGNEGGSQGGE